MALAYLRLLGEEPASRLHGVHEAWFLDDFSAATQLSEGVLSAASLVQLVAPQRYVFTLREDPPPKEKRFLATLKRGEYYGDPREWEPAPGDGLYGPFDGEAVMQGSYDTCFELLEPAPMADAFPTGLLLAAIWRGDVGMLNEALARGADLNGMVRGVGMIQWAARRGTSDIMAALINAGARSLHAPLGYIVSDAISRDDIPLVAAMLPLMVDEFPENRDLQAAGSRSVAMAEFLFANGSVAAGRPESQYKPLCAAVDAFEVSADVIEAFIRHGADPSAPGWGGETPLHRAAGSRFTMPEAVVTSLVRHGADLNARDDRGRTPRRVAAEHYRAAAFDRAVAAAGGEAAPT